MNPRTINASIFKHIALLVFCACMMAGVQAKETRIGFVSSERIMSESAAAKAANAKIEKEFSGRSKELRKLRAKVKETASKLDRDLPVISESERLKRQRDLTDLDKDFRRKQRAFREDLNQRKNEEIAVVVNRASKAIKRIAKSEKYDIILQDAIYFSPRVDITEKVLKELSK